MPVLPSPLRNAPSGDVPQTHGPSAAVRGGPGSLAIATLLQSRLTRAGLFAGALRRLSVVAVGSAGAPRWLGVLS